MSADLDMARAAVDGARIAFAIAVDARSESIRAREAAESAQDALCEKRREALVASYADRGNDALADTVARLDVQIEHARNDLLASVSADELAAADATRCEAELQAAEAELARLETSAMRHDGGVEREFASSAERIVAAVREILEKIRWTLESLSADAALAEACGEAPRDSTTLAGELLRAMLDAGGRVSPGGAELLATDIRSALDPVANFTGTPVDPFSRANRLIPLVVNVLALGDRQPDLDVTNVRQLASVLSVSKHRAEAIDLLRRLREAEGTEIAARVAEAHDARIASHRQREPRDGDSYGPGGQAMAWLNRHLRGEPKAPESAADKAKRRFAEDRRPATPNADGDDPSVPEFGQPTVPLAAAPTIPAPASVTHPSHNGAIHSRPAHRAPMLRSVGGRKRDAMGNPLADGEFIISDALPSTIAPINERGEFERVAATRPPAPRKK